MSSSFESTTSTPSRSVKDISLLIATSGVTTLNVFLNGALTVALPKIGKDLQFQQALVWMSSSVFWQSRRHCWWPYYVFAWFNMVCNMAITGVSVGLGAAANTPAGIRILTTAFPAGRRRDKAFGILGAGQPAWVSPRSDGFALDKEVEDKRYTKGLDWGGAALSTIAIGLLTYSLADSTVIKGGWGAPQIPSLFAVSLMLLGCFFYYERWRETRGLAVLMPSSMWNQPGAKMSSMVSMVFFACKFSLAMLLLHSKSDRREQLPASETSEPAADGTGFAVNIVTGYTMSRIPGQYLILTGLLGSIAAPLIFALIDVDSSYWAMAFLVLIFVDDSQALAGGVFSVATRGWGSLGDTQVTKKGGSKTWNFSRAPGLAPALQNSQHTVTAKIVALTKFGNLVMACNKWVVIEGAVDGGVASPLGGVDGVAEERLGEGPQSTGQSTEGAVDGGVASPLGGVDGVAEERLGEGPQSTVTIVQECEPFPGVGAEDLSLEVKNGSNLWFEPPIWVQTINAVRVTPAPAPPAPAPSALSSVAPSSVATSSVPPFPSPSAAPSPLSSTPSPLSSAPSPPSSIPSLPPPSPPTFALLGH
ncbi:hypothetical protein B0H14DRAFT_2583787 [Mycena olivaceomarginata]|nr:hypothetical protein B0H14DRAFT_2583787 [Mycena olivaceomarginata]